MPSSHAQFVAYFSLSLALFLLFRHTPPQKDGTTNFSQPSHYHKPLTYRQRLGLSAMAFVMAASVALSRIYLDYHTEKQVAAGIAAGAASAVGWFAVTYILRQTGWVEWAVDSWVGQVGRWRDLVVEEDLAEAGWRRWCEKGPERQRKRRGNSVLTNGSGAEGKKVR